jgi:hypothetical protein
VLDDIGGVLFGIEFRFPIHIIYVSRNTSRLQTRPVSRVANCDLKELVSPTCGEYLRYGIAMLLEPAASCDRFRAAGCEFGVEQHPLAA